MIAALADRELRELICLIRDIPFAFTPNFAIRSMLRFGGGSCSPKHALLQHVLSGYGIESRLVYVKLEYQRETFPVPTHCALRQLGEMYGHTSLQVQVEDGWQFLDISFDRFLHPKFQVNFDLELTDCSISKVFDLSVVTNHPCHEERREALGLQSDSDPLRGVDIRDRMKRINKWMIELRRSEFVTIFAERKVLEERLKPFVERFELLDESNENESRVPKSQHGK